MCKFICYPKLWQDTAWFILAKTYFRTFCSLLLPLWESVIVLCFVVRNFMSILVLQSSWWGRESWLLCLICLAGVSRWLSGSSSRCHGVVCSLWLWYFLIILTYYFYIKISDVENLKNCFSYIIILCLLEKIIKFWGHWTSFLSGGPNLTLPSYFVNVQWL